MINHDDEYVRLIAIANRTIPYDLIAERLGVEEVPVVIKSISHELGFDVNEEVL